MRHRTERQACLFDDNTPSQATPQLKEEVAQKANCVLVNWIRALAKTMGTGVGDEQDKR